MQGFRSSTILTIITTGTIGLTLGVMATNVMKAETGDWIQFAGSMAGAGLAGVVAVLTIFIQARMTAEERIKTMEVLLTDLRTAGKNLAADVSFDRARAAELARSAYHATLEVAIELRAQDADIARIAHSLRDDPLLNDFERFREAQFVIADSDARNRGEELVKLAESLIVELHD